MIRPRKIYIVDGNIGSGKSTVLKNLAHLGYSVVYEPLDVWEEKYADASGSLFDKFYADKTKWSFAMQIAVVTSRLRRLEKAIENNTSEILIVERSIYTDRNVFAKNLKNLGHLSEIEHKIFEDFFPQCVDLYSTIVDKIETSHVYLNTSTDVCFQRKERRNRTAESSNALPPDYMVDLGKLHSEWLLDDEIKQCVRVVDGNLSEQEVVNQFLSILQE